MCAKTFFTRKRLLRHVKTAHPRVSDPVPNVLCSDKRSHVDDAYDDTEHIMTEIGSIPVELPIITSDLDEPTVVTELAAIDVDGASVPEHSDAALPAVLRVEVIPVGEPIPTSMPVHVNTHAVAAGVVEQNAAATTIGESRVSDEGEGDEHVPVTRSGEQGVDAVAMVLPFADDETASCKLVGDVFVLRLPKTERLECPRVGCSRGFCAASWITTSWIVRHPAPQRRARYALCRISVVV